MRILFVGVLDIEWSTNCSMKRVLERMGHEVVPFNYRTVAEGFSSKEVVFFDKWLDKAASFLRSEWSPVKLRWYYHRRGRREMNQQLLQTVKKDRFNLILLCKTDSVDFETVAQITQYAPTWYYFMDPFDQALRINVAAYVRNSTWASATFSDVVEHFKQKGANRVYWITQGVDTEIFKPQNAKKIYDVVFVGTKTSLRAHYVSTLISAGIKVECFGKGWKNLPVYNDSLVDVYNQSKIALNFCREGKGFSVRVFQIMGSGCFLLSDYCDDLANFFKKTEYLDWYCNGDELVSLTKYYLREDALRERIAQAGCAMVYQEHSWTKKMKQIIEIAQSKKTV
jgi:hypothetical protein